MIRLLSFLSIACLATAVIILLTSADSDAPIAIVLLLLAFGITTLLGIRRGYHKVRGIVDDARRFVSGDIQEARLVEVGDPSGLFNPEATVVLELEGEDGTRHRFERDVPIPFPGRLELPARQAVQRAARRRHRPQRADGRGAPPRGHGREPRARGA